MRTRALDKNLRMVEVSNWYCHRKHIYSNQLPLSSMYPTSVEQHIITVYIANQMKQEEKNESKTVTHITKHRKIAVVSTL